MNTHSNERRKFLFLILIISIQKLIEFQSFNPFSIISLFSHPRNYIAYPCGFPGCERTFGVRSNAKRHLRTHGVAPTPMAAPTSHVQYVVGFETPVVLPDQRPDGRHYGQGAGVSSSKGLDGEHYDEMGAADEGDEDRGNHEDDFVGHSMGGRPSLRTATYKVRWMPPSVTSRTNMEESLDAFKDYEQRAMHAPHQDRRVDDPYRLNLRHEYEHAPGHAENSYRHNRPPHENRHRYPHSRHDLKGKQRWREDGAYPSIIDMEYSSQTRAPAQDPDTTSSDNNLSAHGTRIKSSSRFARVCACSPPCPVDSSGEVSCQLLVAQPEYAASILGSRLSDSTSPDLPPSGFYNAQTTSSTTRTSQPPYSDALRKTKEEENVIQTELEEGRSYHQAVSHPYAKVTTCSSILSPRLPISSIYVYSSFMITIYLCSPPFFFSSPSVP